MLRKLLAGATTLLVASGLSIIAVAAPVSATGTSPLAELHGFTVLTEGDATMASSSETEGAWAVGGNLIVNQKYDLASMHGGAPLPSVGGQGTQLLVNGKIVFGSVSGEALDVNQGVTRVGDTAGYEVTQSNRYSTIADTSTFVRTASGTDLSGVSAGTLFSDTFGSAFANLRADSTSIASLSAPAATVLSLIDGTNFNGISGNDKGLQLTAGTVNVLHVTAAQLSAISNIKFIGTLPSSGTPLYVDVTDVGNVTVSIPDFLNADAAGVLINFSRATALQFSGPDKIDGSILAPNAAVTHTGATYEGQIVAKTFTAKADREIHHIGFGGGLPQTVSGSFTTTDACDSPSNSLTVNAATHVTYHWTSATVPAGQTSGADFLSYSGTGLEPGTYSFSIRADSGYALTGATSGSHTFTSTTDCAIVIQTAPSSTPPTCDAAGGIDYPTQSDITWTTSPEFTGAAGTYTVTATSIDHRPITAPSSFTVTVAPKGTGLTCIQPPTCLPASAVSYTYDGNPASPTANSGDITVTQLDSSKYTDQLCQGFWVTATSWDYTGPGTWPQSLNVVDKVNGGTEITQVGVYHFAAAVGCGQGDIYASTVASPTPTPILNGPGTPYSEYFLHALKSIGFTGPTPTYLSTPVGCNVVAPVEATVTKITACGTDGSIVVPPNSAFVSYALTSGNGVTGTNVVTATTTAPHVFDDGTLSRSWTIELGSYYDCVAPVASEATGACTANGSTSSSETVSFTFDNSGSTKPVTFEIASESIRVVVPAGEIGRATATAPEGGASYVVTYDGGHALTTLTVAPFDGCKQSIPGDPSATPASCVAGLATGGSIFVDVKPGLIYTIDGPNGFHLSPVTDANTAVAPGRYTVSVAADKGYVLKTDHVWPQSVTVGSPADCGLVTPQAPSASQLVSCTDGSFTLPADADVAWWVDTDNGIATSPTQYPAGNYPVSTVLGDTTVHVEARPANGSIGFEPTATTAWTFAFTAPVAGCLPTLADLPTEVDHADATCQPNGGVTGTITVGPVDSLPFVNYFINGVQVSGATTVLPAGIYQVTASPVDPADTLTPSGPWTVTIAAGGSAPCGDLTTLALTGGNSTGWIALAAILLQLGLGLLAFHVIRNRRRGQHLA